MNYEAMKEQINITCFKKAHQRTYYLVLIIQTSIKRKKELIIKCNLSSDNGWVVERKLIDDTSGILE